jgi:hypothetical protein
MKKRLMPFIGFFSVATAFAAIAVFQSVTGSLVNGDLRVNFRVTGVEGNASADFDVNANVTALYACVNKGGNSPRAASKRATVRQAVSGTGNFTASNGVITGSVTVDTPDSNLTCPNGQEKVLSSVSFTNVRISSDALGISKTLSGSFSRTIVPLK